VLLLLLLLLQLRKQSMQSASPCNVTRSSEKPLFVSSRRLEVAAL